MLEEVLDIIRFINLVTFDSCELDTLSIISTVDPLKKEVTCRLNTEIQKSLHTFLRKTIKKSIVDKDMWVGKIEFLPHTLNMTVYKKRLHKPAYDPNFE